MSTLHTHKHTHTRTRTRVHARTHTHTPKYLLYSIFAHYSTLPLDGDPMSCECEQPHHQAG